MGATDSACRWVSGPLFLRAGRTALRVFLATEPPTETILRRNALRIVVFVPSHRLVLCRGGFETRPYPTHPHLSWGAITHRLASALLSGSAVLKSLPKLPQPLVEHKDQPQLVSMVCPALLMLVPEFFH